MAVLIFKQGNYTETGSLAYAEPIFFTDANTLIISGGVSTYANTEVSPSISAGRVGYRVATIDSINTGSFLTTGDVSASNLLLDGNATVRGNITMGGSGLDFGDASDDNVVFKADISSSFIPNNDDSFDLGSDSQRWKSLYLTNLNLSGSLYVDGGPIDLHSDTYISASSGTFTKLDATTFIDINASGAIDIDSDTSIGIGKNADRPIDIDASTLDIDASSAITIDSTATIAITAGTTASLDGEEAIHIGLEERVPVRIEGQPITINSSTNVDVDADGGKLTLDGSTGIDIGVEADVPIDVDSSTLDIDASGAITINGESTTAISSSGALSIDSETGINIGTTTDKPIDIDASTLDIDASGAVTVDSTSTISLDGVGNSNFTIDSGNLTINNTTSGNMTLQSAGAIDVDADGGKISIDGSSGIDIGVESDVAIDIDSTTFDLDASGNITLDSTTGINIGTANSGVAISIGHTTSETTVNDNLTITGNLTVNGETTYVSSSNVTIGDRIIELNYLGASGNGGIYVGDADGTLTSGSLLWDSTNDYWIAGAKDSEHKIMLSNGDSVISGSGTNNQVALFNSTHGLDSDGNLTFDGSNLRITGTQEITENISGSASASFADLKISDDASIASLTVTDLTNDRVVIVGGGGEIEDSANLTFNGSTLGVTGNVTATASGSFNNVNVTDTITSDSGSFGRVIGSFGSTNGVISGSEQVVLGTIPGFNTYTGSVDTEQSTQNTRLNQLAAATGSYLTSSGSVAFSDVTGKPALLSGSLNAGSNVTINVEGGNYFISSSGGGGGGSNNNTITLEATDTVLNLSADNNFTLNQGSDQTIQFNVAGGVVSGSDQLSGSFALKTTQVTGTSGLSGGGDLSTNRSITLDVSSGTFTDGVTGVVDGLEVISGSAQITALGFVSSSLGDTLQQVTTAGATTNVATTFSNTTDSTSKTTGALIVGGGLGVNNTINAGGDVIAYATSDERLKNNIQPIDGALDKVSQISGNTFDWNEEKQNIYKGKDYGVIAQEIQKVMPELVDTRDNGYLAVKYEKIVPLLIESIKELKKEIEELKSK